MSRFDQDPAVHEPGVRLRLLLALMRVLAGTRGHSALQWSGAGFAYTLLVERGPQLPLTLDADPGALNGELARARLDELFGP